MGKLLPNINLLEIALKDFTSFGGLVLYAIFGLVFYFAGYKEMVLRMFIGLMLMYLFISPLRLIFFTKRPVPEKHANLLEKIDAGSFPSMHATRTTFLAMQLSIFFKDVYLTVLFFLIVTITCYSRIHLRRHHPRDIYVGVILGFLIHLIVNSIL